MRNYKEYLVWTEARNLVKKVYEDAGSFPPNEEYGITSQLKRASISIAANISEGCGRSKELDLARYLDIALGSSKETECLLILANDIGLLDEATFRERQESILAIQSMLTNFLEKIRLKNRCR